MSAVSGGRAALASAQPCRLRSSSVATSGAGNTARNQAQVHARRWIHPECGAVDPPSFLSEQLLGFCLPLSLFLLRFDLESCPSQQRLAAVRPPLPWARWAVLQDLDPGSTRASQRSSSRSSSKRDLSILCPTHQPRRSSTHSGITVRYSGRNKLGDPAPPTDGA